MAKLNYTKSHISFSRVKLWNTEIPKEFKHTLHYSNLSLKTLSLQATQTKAILCQIYTTGDLYV